MLDFFAMTTCITTSVTYRFISGKSSKSQYNQLKQVRKWKSHMRERERGGERRRRICTLFPFDIILLLINVKNATTKEEREAERNSVE